MRITKAMYDTALKHATEDSGTNIEYANMNTIINFSQFPKGGVRIIGLHGKNRRLSKDKTINNWRSYSSGELNKKFAEIEWKAC